MPRRSSEQAPLLGRRQRPNTLSAAQESLSRMEHASVLSGRDIVLMIVCLCLVVTGLYTLIKYDDRRRMDDVCVSRHCVKTGARVLHALDESIDPCKDFVAFATGGWQAKHANGTRVLDEVASDVDRAIHKLATRRIPPEMPDADAHNLGKIQAWYAACLATNDTQPEADTVRALLAMARPHALAWLHAHALDAWFQLSVQPDASSSAHTATLHLAPPTPATVSDIQAGLARLRQVGVSLEVQASDILHLQAGLASAVPEETLVVDELARLAPSIEWDAYFSALDTQPTHIRASAALLRSIEHVWTATPESVWRGYAAWAAVRSLPDGTSRACLRHMQASLGPLLNRYYIAEAKLSGAVVAQAARMADEIRATYFRRLYELPWLDAETRRMALAKASALTIHVAPSASAQELAQQYANLNVSQHRAQNAWRAGAHHMRHALSELGVSPYHARQGPWTAVQAAYLSPHNELDIGAGLLRTPILDTAAPMYLRFGSLGSLLARDMSHALDGAHGQHYDAYGTRRDWWTNATAHAYAELEACMAQQGRDVHEAVSDDAGLVHSYRAWHHILDNGGMRVFEQNQRLPGLVLYSHDQLFFMAYAQLWAERGSEQHARRLHQALAHFAPFAAAFECKAPSTRCHVW